MAERGIKDLASRTLVMPHLFRFGFEGPEEFRSNSTSGTDFESSFAIWISAPSAGEALDWGREIAEQLVRHIFDAAGIAGYSLVFRGLRSLD